jgi:hypothetical protein
MGSNHTLLTIGAFIILTTILQNFYRILGSTGDEIGDAQDMILANTIATSYIEIAQGLSFDSYTDTSNAALGNPSVLTSPSLLGPESSSEDSIQTLDDFDDFNGKVYEKEAVGANKRFKTSFRVYYVDPNNVTTISPSTRTFVKRIDLRTWRSYPPIDGLVTDTLRTSFVMGYWHFD